MPEYIDQIGNLVSLTETPERIISVVPSQTELLADLGLENEIVGITKFCIHPDNIFRSKQRVGGTKKLNLEKIRSLSPDLIIANKEENEKEQILELSKEFLIWTSDIHNLQEALDMITSVGKITGKETEAESLSVQIDLQFKELSNHIPEDVKGKSVLYMIWKDPYMCAGTDTFITNMLNHCGLKNVISKTRYPQLQTGDLIELSPDFIFLSSEPYPFKEKHIKEFEELVPSSKVIVVDGEMFSWYGSRLLKAPGYFKELLSDF